jgi:hypothetical protein
VFASSLSGEDSRKKAIGGRSTVLLVTIPSCEIAAS